MINLAGRKDCDTFIRQELEGAGVPIVTVHTVHSEVPYALIGRMGRFEFHRAWYYWMVSGNVPMDAANEMYADPVGVTDVRVVGHCGCPPPKEWEYQGHISHYHIDSQEGLNLFVQTMKRHGLDA